jgi:solute carrier family 25 protein 34/35
MLPIKAPSMILYSNFQIKTHLQSLANESSIAVGHQHHHRRMTPAMIAIYKEFGVKGLYRGITSTLPRVVVASAVQLSTFSKSLGTLRLKKK